MNFIAYVLGALNLAKVDGFHETGRSREDAGVEATTSRGNDLATTAMDGVSVKGHVVDVETDSAHVLVTKDTFLGSPLEAGNNRVLDFVQVLHT